MNSSNLQFEILLPGASGLHRSPQRGGEYVSLELQSLIKIGGTNLFNHYYQNGFGNPAIGGLYYVSLGFRVL